jgi:hypothetical protein
MYDKKFDEESTEKNICMKKARIGRDEKVERNIDVSDYLNRLYEIQNTSALYSIDPLRSQDWACKK